MKVHIANVATNVRVIFLCVHSSSRTSPSYHYYHNYHNYHLYLLLQIFSLMWMMVYPWRLAFRNVGHSDQWFLKVFLLFGTASGTDGWW